MGIMAFINLPVIVILGGLATKALNDYVEQRRQGNNPVFKAKDIGMDESKLDYWK